MADRMAGEGPGGGEMPKEELGDEGQAEMPEAPAAAGEAEMPEATVAERQADVSEEAEVEGQLEVQAAPAEGQVEVPEPLAAEGQEEVAVEYLDVLFNSMGVFDGNRFYLRSFPVWDTWKPEVGLADDVWFAQTMGRMVLWYELSGPDDSLTEEDFVVEMSSWELRVSVGRDVPVGKAGPRKITGLCGEFHGDVRRKLSWWEISDNEDYPGRWLVVTLSKLEHKAWPGPWFEGPLNPHRKTSFGWAPLHMSEHLAKMLKPEDEFLQRLPPGEPHEYIKSLYTGILPERLCTGIEDDEGDTPEQISLVLHLNAEALELATGLVPLEELFAAEVEPDRLDIYLRFDGFSICAGTLTGFVVPELTSWEITNVRRKELPAEGGAKNPAFYNPALRVTLVKARDFQDTWGHVFAGLRLPQLQPPPERMNVMERMLRAAALSPAAPMQVTAKTERAQRLCTRVECSQDRYKASVIMHLEDRLEEAVEKYKIDITTFFSMRVGERVLELNVVADTEYRMCVGGLGGNCRPADTTWEIIRERNQPDEEREHLALKIDLPKASRGMWKEVFARWEPWQVSEAMLQAMEEQLQLEAGAAEAQRQALEADRPAEERLPSQPAEQAATAPEALQAEMPAEVPPETDHPRGSPSETPAAPAAEEPAGLATTEAPGPLIGTAGEEETQARPAPTAEVEHQSSPADETVEEEIEVE